jgi:hypothetical protein
MRARGIRFTVPPTAQIDGYSKNHDEPEIPIHPALEYEIVQAEVAAAATASTAAQPRREKATRPPSVILCDARLLLSFVGLILFGSANAVLLKLQAVPMYNYPNFLNLFCNIMYIPICFAYIIPATRNGWFQTNHNDDDEYDPGSSSPAENSFLLKH